jgi:hypothetical protein
MRIFFKKKVKFVFETRDRMNWVLEFEPNFLCK